VTFKRQPPNRPFEDPTWEDVTPEMWKDLRLKPKKKLRQRWGKYESKLIKKFRWPTEALL